MGMCGFEPILDTKLSDSREVLTRELTEAGAQRIWYIGDAFRLGWSMETVYSLTGVDPWYLVQIEELIKLEQGLMGRELASIEAAEMRQLKRKGFADKRLAGDRMPRD